MTLLKTILLPLSLAVSISALADFSTLDNKLAIQLLQYNNTPTNTLISPYGAASMASILQNGLREKDSATLLKKLGYPSSAALNKSYQDSLAAITSSANNSSNVLYTANSAWIQQGNDFNFDFKNTMRQFYQAQFFITDFAKHPEDAKKKINNWISNSTRKFIPQFFTPADDVRTMILALLNTTYFQGVWLHPFDKEANTQAYFYTSPQQKYQTTFMHDSEHYDYYYKDKQIQLIELPYRSTISFFLVLPNPHTSLNAVIKNLTPKKLSTWEQALFSNSDQSRRMIQLSLPKFEFENLLDLKDPLAKLGYISKSNLYPDMTQRPAILSSLQQKAKILLNEEGTIAAQVTISSLIGMAAPSAPVILNFNRPFLFFIQDTNTHAILFIGTVYQPKV